MNSETIDNAFRDRLRELIGDEKPFAWAKRIHIPPGTFNRIWNEGVVPKGEVLAQIAKETGVDLNWLVVGLNVPHHGLTANGNGIIQGHNIDTDELHIDIIQAPGNHDHIKESHLQYSDPVSMAFLKDWQSLNDVAKMRVWTMVKEEIARDKELKEGGCD